MKDEAGGGLSFELAEEGMKRIFAWFEETKDYITAENKHKFWHDYSAIISTTLTDRLDVPLNKVRLEEIQLAIDTSFHLGWLFRDREPKFAELYQELKERRQ